MKGDLLNAIVLPELHGEIHFFLLLFAVLNGEAVVPGVKLPFFADHPEDLLHDPVFLDLNHRVLFVRQLNTQQYQAIAGHRSTHHSEVKKKREEKKKRETGRRNVKLFRSNDRKKK